VGAAPRPIVSPALRRRFAARGNRSQLGVHVRGVWERAADLRDGLGAARLRAVEDGDGAGGHGVDEHNQGLS
jgi:hypothetical protein